MDTKIIKAAMMMLLLSGLVDAVSFGHSWKAVNAVDQEQAMIDYNRYKIFSTLIENTESCYPDCYAIYNITNKIDKPIKLKNLRTDIHTMDGELKTNKLTKSSIEVYEQSTECESYEVLAGTTTSNCITYVSGYQPLDKQELQPGKTTYIRIKGTKVSNEPLEWIPAFTYKRSEIPTLEGVADEIDVREIAWAVWNTTNYLNVTGQLSRYYFDEGTGTTAKDIGLSAKNGVYNGAWVDGIDGTAIYPNAANISYSATIGDLGQTPTVCWWMNPQTFSSGAIIGYGGSADAPDNTHGFLIRGAATNVLNIRREMGGTVDIKTNVGDINGIWTHFCVTFEPLKTQIYMNGTYLNQTTHASHTLSYVNYNTTIGGLQYADRHFSQFFNGKIDTVQIFNTNLTTTQINDIYQSRYHGIKARYDMDMASGNAIDRSGNIINSVVSSGDVSYSQSGKFGTAVSMSGQILGTGFNWTGANAGALTLQQQFTISGWVKPLRDNGGYSVIFMSGYFDNAIFLNTNNGTHYKLGINTRNGANTLTDTFTIPQGVWTHVAWTHQNGTDPTDRIYINGTQVKTANRMDGGQSTVTEAYIGGSKNNGYFNGSIDEVSIYSRPLNASDILNLYNNRQDTPDATPEITWVFPTPANATNTTSSSFTVNTTIINAWSTINNVTLVLNGLNYQLFPYPVGIPEDPPYWPFAIPSPTTLYNVSETIIWNAAIAMNETSYTYQIKAFTDGIEYIGEERIIYRTPSIPTPLDTGGSCLTEFGPHYDINTAQDYVLLNFTGMQEYCRSSDCENIYITNRTAGLNYLYYHSPYHLMADTTFSKNATIYISPQTQDYAYSNTTETTTDKRTLTFASFTNGGNNYWVNARSEIDYEYLDLTQYDTVSLKLLCLNYAPDIIDLKTLDKTKAYIVLKEQPIIELLVENETYSETRRIQLDNSTAEVNLFIHQLFPEVFPYYFELQDFTGDMRKNGRIRVTANVNNTLSVIYSEPWTYTLLTDIQLHNGTDYMIEAYVPDKKTINYGWITPTEPATKELIVTSPVIDTSINHYEGLWWKPQMDYETKYIGYVWDFTTESTLNYVKVDIYNQSNELIYTASATTKAGEINYQLNDTSQRYKSVFTADVDDHSILMQEHWWDILSDTTTKLRDNLNLNDYTILGVKGDRIEIFMSWFIFVFICLLAGSSFYGIISVMAAAFSGFIYWIGWIGPEYLNIVLIIIVFAAMLRMKNEVEVTGG